MIKQRRTVSILILALAAGAVGVLGTAPTPAHAVSCYGDYCSGLDPQSSGCAADAYTVFSESVYGTAGATYVEVRWSPTCKTNWARTNIITTNIKAEQDTGYVQGYSTNNGSMSWSKMIYSPVHHVRGVLWGNWGTTVTPWA